MVKKMVREMQKIFVITAKISEYHLPPAEPAPDSLTNICQSSGDEPGPRPQGDQHVRAERAFPAAAFPSRAPADGTGLSHGT